MQLLAWLAVVWPETFFILSIVCVYTFFLQLFVRRIVTQILLEIMHHRNVHYYYYGRGFDESSHSLRSHGVSGTIFTLLFSAVISPQWHNEKRQPWTSVPCGVACETVSLMGSHSMFGQHIQLTPRCRLVILLVPWKIKLICCLYGLYSLGVSSLAAK